MNMREFSSYIALALYGQLGLAQGLAPASGSEVPGYYDTATGAFRPVAQAQAFDYDSVATTAANGTLVVNFTIAVKSAIPTASPILCEVGAAMYEKLPESGYNIIADSASVAATRTGATARCKVTIPYSWAVLNPANATVHVSYSVTASKTSTPPTGLLSRSTSDTIGSIALPANGATTTLAVNPTL